MNKYKFLIFLLPVLIGCQSVKDRNFRDSKSKNLIVLSFNIWVGGEAGGQPIDKSVEVIRLSEAMVAGIQEGHSYNSDGTFKSNNAMKIAEMLGWNYFSQGRSAIITSLSLVDSTAERRGVKLQLGENEYFWIFNCHLYHMPYQPYQLAGIKYGDFPFISTEQEAIDYANQTRREEISKYLKEIIEVMKEGWPVILTGDFNEPSFLDWTEKAKQSGIKPLKVEWPTTKSCAEIGMLDSFREVHPDEVSVTGETWSSLDTPGEIHDRIDFILFKGKYLKVEDSYTIGFNDGKSDKGMDDYPSDHRAVCTNFIWND
jgi:exodeoxyribonuclease III